MSHVKEKTRKSGFLSSLSTPKGPLILQEKKDFRKPFFLLLAAPVGIYQRGSRGFCGSLQRHEICVTHEQCNR